MNKFRKIKKGQIPKKSDKEDVEKSEYLLIILNILLEIFVTKENISPDFSLINLSNPLQRQNKNKTKQKC